jgi:adenylate kinase
MNKTLIIKFLLITGGIFVVWFLANNISKHYKKNKVENKIIFSFFGAPGSGKGTLSEQCKQQLGFQSLSTGDLCRENIKKQTDFGKQLQQYTKEGKLVPDEIIFGMVKNWFKEKASPSSPIILDGFPRTKEQAAMLNQFLKESMPDYQFRVVRLVLPKEEIVERLGNRVTCEKCQAVYNLSMPEAKSGICPKCGGKLIQREDDKPEVIEKRFEVYQKNEADILNYYKSVDQKIEEMNISKLSPKEVFEKFKSLI